ncbi:MAG: hypothetical protein IPP06_18295 [Saprospiraceae bacterium]|nr:hypothetical protein [Candidatus Vicinibacter affinis]MBK9963201.1 hypothetical protein [Candidatus Vicinibacter affinis]
MKLFQVLFFTFCFGSLLAQPLIHEYSCHHSSQLNLKHEPTLQELQLIENSNKRSDSINILNYSIYIDVTDVRNKSITAHTTVNFKTKLPELEWIILDLKDLVVDSIYYKGRKLNFSYSDQLIQAYFGEKLPAEFAASIDVFYHGVPSRDPVWGGFYFADPYIYNLGIGLSSTPPNYGKVWFPCFDNFVERSTYDYYVTSSSPARAYCVGTFISEDSLSDNRIYRHYSMKDEIPTYLSSIAVSEYVTEKLNHQGVFGNVPIELIARKAEMNQMKTQFDKLPKAIDAFEFWFGPYRFERVGFVATTQGAMEHPTNTAYPVGTITGGDLTQNERLFAHEFGHQWWGNLTTLDDARDMWIKEGNAEYSAHLFFEFVYGRERFVKVVKENLANIIFNAHLNDGDYLPLSPMPYESTYGTHTYRKGAAMIHNLRGYLGDSTYRNVCHVIFDSLSGSSMNAFQFRDFLSRNSGMDMTNFFNDHIFNRGYCAFYVDSFEFKTVNGKNYAEVNIKQKGHHADHIFTEAPLKISFYDRKLNRFENSLILSGSSSWRTIELPDNFQAAFILLNDGQQLNLASLQDQTIVSKTGGISLSGSGMSPNVAEITDSAFVHIVHHLVGPSAEWKLDNVLKISSNHFWQVNTVPFGKLKLTGRLDYNGSNAQGLDSDIIYTSEDSVILVYRKDWTEPWREYSDYTRLKVTPNDRRGFMRLDVLIPGEYALANGYSSLTRITDEKLHKLEIYPNPAHGFVHVKLPEQSGIVALQMVDNQARLIRTISVEEQLTAKTFEILNYQPGQYQLLALDKTGLTIGCTQLEIH